MNDKTRELLETPFSKELIRSRKGAANQTFSYVEIGDVIRRLNQAFEHDWSFELTSREVVEDQVIVEGKLTAAGVVKTGVGGTAITRRRDDGTAVSIADDVKTAEADCIKRCARLYGLGLDLWATEPEQPRQPESTQSRPADRLPAKLAPAQHQRDRIGASQLSAILAVVRERRINEVTFRQRVKARFGRTLEFLSGGQAEEIIQSFEEDSQPHNGDSSGNARTGV